MKEIKRNMSCHICYIDTQNTAYLISYLTSSFKRARHLQNGNLKNSITQEHSYT